MCILDIVMHLSEGIIIFLMSVSFEPFLFQIDLDTIDVSNLNRQFLFRKEHVGMSKAKASILYVSAEYIVQVYGIFVCFC